MKIHTCKEGEKLSDIAKLYGVTEENIIISNISGCEYPAAGEELLILTPTRTYKLKEGDSIERLCLRFGVRKCDIFAWNPWISETGLAVGRSVNLKFDDRIFGTAPANGYLYSGYDPKRLRRALPYLTYITIGAASADDRGIKSIFDDRATVSALIGENKIPLLRIFDKAKRNYKNGREEFISNIISAASAKGYLGVVLSAESNCDISGYGEFLIELRKAMIGCDLILVLEVTPKTPSDICELADGNILFYPKYAVSPELSYENGEREVYPKFATECESAKCFIDISALGKGERSFLPIEEALTHARADGSAVAQNESAGICEMQDKNQGRIHFNSLKNIKSTLELIEEFGFMGASFDINRTPISHFLMYNMYFKTAAHTYARAKEGCSR